MVKIACISDTHLLHNQLVIPECDVLIHSGDACNYGNHRELVNFVDWLEQQDQAKHKIFVPGNHDCSLDPEHRNYNLDSVKRLQDSSINYLVDELVTIEGITFYGSPWVRQVGRWAFGGIEPGIMPFYTDRQLYDLFFPIRAYKGRIDVLVTHTGPLHISGMCSGFGSSELTCAVIESKPKYHIFGHSHYHGGKMTTDYGINFINAASCNDEYNLSRQPFIFES